MGPTAMRLLGIVDRLKDLGVDIVDGGDAFVMNAKAPVDKRDRAHAAVRAYSVLKERVAKSYAAGKTPLVVSGDHSLAIPTVSAALEKYGRGLAVLWIDAHMDLNNPTSSPSGNLHGMPLGALMRLEPGLQTNDDQAGALTVWPSILSDIVPQPGLQAGQVAWVGLRDVDPGEVENYKNAGCEHAFTMQDVDRMGINAVMAQVFLWLEESGAEALWVSFDVDSLDPLLAPGTGTKVRGGLTYREGHFVAELLCEYFQFNPKLELAGLDVVEVNPMTDRAGETALVASEWLCSFFGQTIMGVKP